MVKPKETWTSRATTIQLVDNEESILLIGGFRCVVFVLVHVSKPSWLLIKLLRFVAFRIHNIAMMKDNANPIIHSVSKEASAASWESILETELSNDSPANRAISQALEDAEGTPVPKRPPFPWRTMSSHHQLSRSDDPIQEDEIFEIIRSIQDPEHPLTLEQLGVVSRQQIDVDLPYVRVRFTPTIPHCSMATLIGLSITVKLLRSCPPQCKMKVSIEPGTHNSESSINKQLADKERVCAALENKHLLSIVNKCIAEGMANKPQ